MPESHTYVDVAPTYTCACPFLSSSCTSQLYDCPPTLTSLKLENSTLHEAKGTEMAVSYSGVYDQVLIVKEQGQKIHEGDREILLTPITSSRKVCCL